MTIRFAVAAALAAGVMAGVQIRADDAPAAPTPAPTRHQLMKDCMAKQRLSEAGRTTEDMKKDCREITKPEKQNVDAEKKSESTPPT